MIGDNEKATRPDGLLTKDCKTELTTLSDIGAITSRIAKRVDLVNRLLQQDPTISWLPAGTLRTFGGTDCVWCPAGHFIMGSPEAEEHRDEHEHQHLVILTHGFWISSCQVTQINYLEVVGSNPSKFRGDLNLPVEQVSWDEAVEYCKKITAAQRYGRILPEGYEWRLPTEAEWEYAARAGTTGPRHGQLQEIAWLATNSGDQSHPVKQKEPNAWGLYDMIGNVWEWCADWDDEYYYEECTPTVTDPKGPASAGERSSQISGRVIRGGSFQSEPEVGRVAFRYGHPRPDVSLGFRPVLCPIR